MPPSRFLVLSLFLVAGPSALAAQPAARPRPAQPAQPTARQPAPAVPAPPTAQPPAGPPAPPSPPPSPAVALPPATPTSLVDVQVLLDRASYSPGVIDGRGGSNTRKAVEAFQAAHDLPVTGKVDAATWQNLTAASGLQPLALYTVLPADVAGPFVEIPRRIEDQAELPALGYTSPLELLGEKFHCAPELLQALNPGVDFSVAGQAIKVPNVPPFVPWTKDQPLPERAGLAGVRVIVSKSRSTLTVENGDDVIFFAPVTAGSEHDPLPLGEWKVRGVSRAPVFHFNPKLFWDAKPTDTKATVPAGPNNPVGAVWIDLSKDHYGIHGTPEPQLIGKTLSHGCVRLTNWDAQAVAALVKPGTPVLFEP
ncbi:MAG TPA: L,D-transpeptidase [Thermoanaerobaculia bacterium]